MDRPLFGTTMGSSTAKRNQTSVHWFCCRGKKTPDLRPRHLTCRDIVLGTMAVFFDVHGGGEEERSTRHGDEGAEQHGELQRTKLPEEGVPLPQRVGHLRGTDSGLTSCTRVQYSTTACASYHSDQVRTSCVSQQVRDDDLQSLGCGAPRGNDHVLRTETVQ